MFRLLLIFLLIMTSPAFASNDAVSLKPYSAKYAVKYKGFMAGYVHFVLLPKTDNTYVYLSRVEPGTLASLVVSSEAFERTIIRVDGEGVRPLSWVSEDGKSKTEDDGQLTFDWEKQRVFGTVEDEFVDMSTEPGLQNRLSMQVEVLRALLSDEQPGTISMIDKKRIKHYSYVHKGAKLVTTDAGSYEAILYESTREGSKRFKRIYHAPKLDFIPVLLENYRKGKLETVMELVEFKLDTNKDLAGTEQGG